MKKWENMPADTRKRKLDAIYGQVKSEMEKNDEEKIKGET